MMDTAAMLEPMTFDHAGISVANLEVSRQFYADVLGFTTLEDEFALPHYGLRGAVILNPQGVRIELFERQGSSPVRKGNPSGDPIIQGWFQLALSVKDLDTTFAELVRRGARSAMDPRVAPDGRARVAFILDPDNNLIELLQRPVSPAPVAVTGPA